MFFVIICNEWCATIPGSWIVMKSQSFLWPPKNKNATNESKKASKPSKDWTSLKYSKYLGPFPTFDEARSRETQILNISTNDDESFAKVLNMPLQKTSTKRTKKIPSRYKELTTSDDDTVENLRPKSKYPKPPSNMKLRDENANIEKSAYISDETVFSGILSQRTNNDKMDSVSLTPYHSRSTTPGLDYGDFLPQDPITLQHKIKETRVDDELGHGNNNYRKLSIKTGPDIIDPSSKPDDTFELNFGSSANEENPTIGSIVVFDNTDQGSSDKRGLESQDTSRRQYDAFESNFGSSANEKNPTIGSMVVFDKTGQGSSDKRGLESQDTSRRQYDAFERNFGSSANEKNPAIGSMVVFDKTGQGSSDKRGLDSEDTSRRQHDAFESNSDLCARAKMPIIRSIVPADIPLPLKPCTSNVAGERSSVKDSTNVLAQQEIDKNDAEQSVHKHHELCCSGCRADNQLILRKVIAIWEYNCLGQEGDGPLQRNNALPAFPMCTLQELKKFEKLLAEDATARLQYKLMVKVTGGRDVKRHVRSVFREILDDNVAYRLSWTGQKNTIMVKDKKFVDLIIESLISCRKDCTIHEIQQAISAWLNHAGDRLRYNNKEPNDA